MERVRRVFFNTGIPIRQRCRDPRPRPPPVLLSWNDFRAEGDIDPGFFPDAHVEDFEAFFANYPEDELPFKFEETPKFGSASIGDKSVKSAIKEWNSRAESSLSFEERDQRATFVQQMVFSIIFNEERN